MWIVYTLITKAKLSPPRWFTLLLTAFKAITLLSLHRFFRLFIIPIPPRFPPAHIRLQPISRRQREWGHK